MRQTYIKELYIMKSLLVSIIAALLVILVVLAAGDVHGIDITVSKALVSTYWLTIPMIIVGVCVAVFGTERD